MKPVLYALIFIAGLLLASSRVFAMPDVAYMSDIEVSEYAERMSHVIEEIQYRQLCTVQDSDCVRAEFARHGVSYDDKESVQKRLLLMVGKVF